MIVKGGISYIDFNFNDVTTTRTFVLKGVYSYFNKAFKSKKVVILRNVVITQEKLCDIVTDGVRQKSNSDFVTLFRLPSNTTASGLSRHVSVSADDTVTITTV